MLQLLSSIAEIEGREVKNHFVKRLTFGATYPIMNSGATKVRWTFLVPVKKIGRPTDSPKTFMLRVKMDKDTLAKLDECCKMTNLNRSEFVRRNICEKYDALKKWKEAALNPSKL